MDKFLVSAIGVFVVVVALSMVALLSPQWLVTDIAGLTQYGLLYTCYGVPDSTSSDCELAFTHSAWQLAAVLIVLSVVLFVSSAVLLLAALRKGESTSRTAEGSLLSWGKWIGFIGTSLLCMAGLVFPAGFGSTELGGKGYLLPSIYQVGYSYVLLLLAAVFSVVGQLAANRLFISRFRR